LERERRGRRGWGSAILTGEDATEEGAMGRARFRATEEGAMCPILDRPASGLVVPFASSADREGGDRSGWRGCDFLGVEKGEAEAKRMVFITRQIWLLRKKKNERETQNFSKQNDEDFTGFCKIYNKS